jgi:hypothetical protein
MSAATMLDAVKYELKLKNDAVLARTLDMTPPAICKVRSGDLPVGSILLLRIHETTGWPTKKIKKMASEKKNSKA